MHRAALALPLLVGLLLVGILPLNAVAHLGGHDPLLEGWTVVPGDAGISRSVGDPEFPGLQTDGDIYGTGVWEVDNSGAQTLRYQRTGPGPVVSWILEARLRVVALADAADAGIQIEVANGARRFELDFGSDAQGATRIGLVGSNAAITIAPMRAPGIHTDYATIQLVYSAVDGSADLFVNGLEVASDWVGVPTSLDRVLFGDGSVEPGGRARYARVELVAKVAACRDGIDDDGDGRADFAGADPDCSQENDPAEWFPQRFFRRLIDRCYDGVDTDLDVLCDVDEVLLGTGPRDSDADDDGILDGGEVWLGTSPLDSDTDGDGVTDGEELAGRTDPRVAGAYPDLDGDAVADLRDNCVRHANGPYGISSPFDSQIDTDLDGYGNRCDADYNNNGAPDGGDFNFLIRGFNVADRTRDLSGDGVLTGGDFGIFVSLFNKPPGPSGLVCAGRIPCDP